MQNECYQTLHAFLTLSRYSHGSLLSCFHCSIIFTFPESSLYFAEYIDTQDGLFLLIMLREDGFDRELCIVRRNIVQNHNSENELSLLLPISLNKNNLVFLRNYLYHPQITQYYPAIINDPYSFKIFIIIQVLLNIIKKLPNTTQQLSMTHIHSKYSLLSKYYSIQSKNYPILLIVFCILYFLLYCKNLLPIVSVRVQTNRWLHKLDDNLTAFHPSKVICCLLFYFSCF